MMRLAIMMALLVDFSYAEYPWIWSNLKAKEAFINGNFPVSIDYTEEALKDLEKRFGNNHPETLLAVLRKMRFRFVARQEASFEKLQGLFDHLGKSYHPHHLKLFNEFYYFCFNLLERKHYKMCWWLIQEIQMLYLNHHSLNQLNELSSLRHGIIDLLNLKLELLNSEFGYELIQSASQRQTLSKEVIEEAYALGSVSALLRLAEKSQSEGDLKRSSHLVSVAIEKLDDDWSDLLGYLKRNEYAKLIHNRPVHYASSLAFALREAVDLLELIGDSNLLMADFPALKKTILSDYLRGLELIVQQRLLTLQQMTPHKIFSEYEPPSGRHLHDCKESILELVKALRLHHIDNGTWLELNAVENFENSYTSIKLLSRQQYLGFFSRKLMRKCYTKLNFKYPLLDTDYHQISIDSSESL